MVKGSNIPTSSHAPHALLAFAVFLSLSATASAQPPLGVLESIDPVGNAAGWAGDPDALGTSINLHFYVDGPAGIGVFAGVVRADQPRPDINARYGVPGNYGFAFSIPPQFRDSRAHTLYVHGIDTSGNAAEHVLLSNVPQSFQLVAPPPSLTSITPGTITNGSSVTLTFSGSNFQPGAVLVYQVPSGGTGSVPATVVSSTTLTLTLNAVNLPIGSYQVAVQNPDWQRSSPRPVVVEVGTFGTLLSVAWTGQVNVRGAWYPGRLYVLQSRPGSRPNRIDRALALVIQPWNATGATIVHLVGGRNAGPNSSFSQAASSTVADIHVDNRAALDAGITVVFAEYRGSLNPGGPDTRTPPSPTDASVFSPPLPTYGALIPGYDIYEGADWAHGDLEDAVAVVEFVKRGGAGPVDPARVWVVGSSHGGYLALAVSHRVPGLARVVSLHGGADTSFYVQFNRQPPPVPYPGRPTSDTPLKLLEEMTAWVTPLEVKDGYTWSNNREAYLQRLFRQAGGEPEFQQNKPGCALFTTPPLSTQTLVISDINDLIATTEVSRRYVRHWAAQYPGIRLLEHNVVAETGVFDPSQFHGSPQLETPWVQNYLLTGAVPAQVAGPIQSSVRGRVLDLSTGGPLAGATVEIGELFDGCVAASKTAAVTGVDGVVHVPQVPAGFVKATVAKAGFTPQTFQVFVSNGMNDFTATPVPLTPAAPAQDTTPPAVTITSPAFGAIVSGIVPVGVWASDNVGVHRVELRIDGVLQAVDVESPYGFDWDATTFPSGAYTIEVTAYDAAGNRDVHSIVVTIQSKVSDTS